MSQADLTMAGHSGAHGGTTVCDSFEKAGDVAVHHFRCHHLCCLPGGYGFLRNGTPNWPTPFKFSPSIINAMVMTFILVTSSLTMLMGVRAAKAGDQARRFAGH